uniref:Uncharacterized protein n=1 Tax=Lotharella oceanica TaxID=641309 RepID=A0A7S2TEW3_9EUKA
MALLALLAMSAMALQPEQDTSDLNLASKSYNDVRSNLANMPVGNKFFFGGIHTSEVLDEPNEKEVQLTFIETVNRNMWAFSLMSMCVALVGVVLMKIFYSTPLKDEDDKNSKTHPGHLGNEEAW